jgi:Ser/Thr protein kinase RdoA (MazF antagonist)
VPVNSPRCFHVGDGTTTPLLLEDLAGLRMGDQVAGLSVAEAETLMGTLAALHAAYWESPALEAPWLLRHDTGAYPTLVGMLVGSGAAALEKQFADRTPEPVLRGVLELCTRWDALIVANAAGPQTLVHNDCRLDNIFFADDGTPTLIDWQIVSRTRGAQDVANLLAGSMRADDLSAHWERLLRLYHGGLRLHGVTGYSLDELIDHYRANVFYPLGAGLALLGAMAIGDARSLGDEIVARCLRHIEEVDALGALDALAGLDALTDGADA